MRVHVRIFGRVQGVGFRYATEREARRLGLNGWVRNVSDGSVEAEFSGDDDAVTSMLEWCERGPALARVTEVKATPIAASGDYDSFTVRA